MAAILQAMVGEEETERVCASVSVSVCVTEGLEETEDDGGESPQWLVQCTHTTIEK